MAAPKVSAVGTEIAPADVTDKAPLELYGTDPPTVFMVTDEPLIVTLPVPAKEYVVSAALEVNVPVAFIAKLPVFEFEIVCATVNVKFRVAVIEMLPATVDALETLAPNAMSRAEVMLIVPDVVELVNAALIKISAAAPFEVIVRVFDVVPDQVIALAIVMTPVPAAAALVELMLTLPAARLVNKFAMLMTAVVEAAGVNV